MLLKVAHGRGHVVGGGYGDVVHPWSKTILVELLVLHTVLHVQHDRAAQQEVPSEAGEGLGLGLWLGLGLGFGLGLGLRLGST